MNLTLWCTVNAAIIKQYKVSDNDNQHIHDCGNICEICNNYNIVKISEREHWLYAWSNFEIIFINQWWCTCIQINEAINTKCGVIYYCISGDTTRINDGDMFTNHFDNMCAKFHHDTFITFNTLTKIIKNA